MLYWKQKREIQRDELMCIVNVGVKILIITTLHLDIKMKKTLDEK